MKKSLTVLAMIALSSISTATFAAKKDANVSMPKHDNQMTVGNENAASNGSKFYAKSVKIDRNDSMIKKDHDMNVGKENAASNGSKFEDKSVKETMAHTKKGKSHSKKK